MTSNEANNKHKHAPAVDNIATHLQQVESAGAIPHQALELAAGEAQQAARVGHAHRGRGGGTPA